MRLIKSAVRLNIAIVLGFFLLSIPLILPFFYSGYFPTHDGEWAVVRLSDMFRSLRDFQFPVRYSGSLNFGHGYPLFNFAYPGPYYLGVVIYFVAGSFITATKVIFALSIPLSAITMYFASKKLWGSIFAGFFSGIIYIYMPYRMVDLYVRGSIGESISFVLFPIILYLALLLFDKKRTTIIVALVSIAVAFLVTAHNIMTILFLPILIFFLGFKIYIEKRFDLAKPLLLSLFLSLGLSAFFWIPALLEKSNISLSISPIADRSLYFVNLHQVIVPSWGYGVPTESGGFSYQLGIAQIVVIISFMFFAISQLVRKKIKKSLFQIGLFFVLIWLVYFTLMFSFTSFVWQSVPLLNEINYPWTILSQLGFLSSLLAGSMVLFTKSLRYLLAAVLFATCLSIVPYAKPSEYINRTDDFYITNDATTTSSSELMPIWVETKPTKMPQEKVVLMNGSIYDLDFNSKHLAFTAKNDISTQAFIYTIYYPGWRAFIDNTETEILYDNPMGIMRINIPSGVHKVKLLFTETPVRLFADLISVFSVVFLILYIIRKKYV